jgi:outer membrane protein OmpA-like peptidoglycan-associated protein
MPHKNVTNDAEEGAIHHATGGGVSGALPAPDPFQLLVAPSTSNELNVAHLRLIPIACFRVDDVRFRFDSSFLLFDTSSATDTSGQNDIRAEMEDLANLIKAHPGSPLSVFGHADPTGTDDYNKVVSGRRAKAIFGMLTRDTGMWESLFSGPKPIAGDNWGNDSLQTMRSATGLPGNTPRNVLFRAYMDALCGADFKLAKTDFLARGEDPEGKGDIQGCGEFNPVLVFSHAKQQEFEKAKDQQDQTTLERRNSENAPNRRVMILLFRPGSRINPAKWPCPRVTEGVAGCKLRFFSDGEERRGNRLARDNRKFQDSKDTFACRFYQRISHRSPCEATGGRLRILLDDPFLGFLPGISVKVNYASGTNETLVADERAGIAVLVDQGNFADLEFKTSLTSHSLRVFILLAGVSTRAGAWQRLVNLGYVHNPQPPSEPPSDDALATAVAEFQASHGIVPTGLVDGPTAQAIETSYDLTVAWQDEQRTQLPDDLASESASLPKDAVA